MVIELTRRAVNKMTCVRAGSVVLLLLCLAASASVLVAASPVRVKSGDWIRYDSINIGKVPFNSQTAWSKVEFLNVSGPTAILRVTMNRTTGTQETRTTKINVAFDSQSFGGFSGFVIPSDLNVGNVFRVSGWGNVTITGETTRTYVGASRTVVYAPYSGSGTSDESETQTISYWDRKTGIFLEEATTGANYTMSFRATETNMWSPSGSRGFDWQLLALIVIPVAAVIAATALTLRLRKRKTSITPPSQNETRAALVAVNHRESSVKEL